MTRVHFPSFAGSTTISNSTVFQNHKNNFQDLFVRFKEALEILAYFVIYKYGLDFHATFATTPSSFLVYYSIFFLETTDVNFRKGKHKSPPMRRSLSSDPENIHRYFTLQQIHSPPWEP